MGCVRGGGARRRWREGRVKASFCTRATASWPQLHPVHPIPAAIPCPCSSRRREGRRRLPGQWQRRTPAAPAADARACACLAELSPVVARDDEDEKGDTGRGGRGGDEEKRRDLEDVERVCHGPPDVVESLDDWVVGQKILPPRDLLHALDGQVELLRIQGVRREEEVGGRTKTL
eukprot:749722-Hanusia_phi.AAC.5